MPAHRAFPLQLVNQVIDELGEESHRWDDNLFLHKTLRACALVSKRWTAPSRVHLFRKVKIEGDRHKHTITPPAIILPYVKELEVYYDHYPTQPTPIGDFLKAFVAAPIECLVITGVALVDERACIQETIDAHSATLHTVEFGSCSLSTHNITDIFLGRHHLRSLRLVDCKSHQLPSPGQPLIANAPDSGAHSKAVELELGIFGGDPFEGSADVVSMVTQLQYRFKRLDFDHIVAGEEATEVTNALIKANADVLSSLRVRFLAEDMEVDVEPEHLFSLKDCSNLSELTLDMKNSESYASRDSTFVLSTLDPARLSHLGKIVLTYNYVGRWFNKDGQFNDKNGWADAEDVDEGSQADSDDDQAGSECEDGDGKKDWEGLDAVLAKLAKASISMRKKKLTFTLVVLRWGDNNKLMSTARKWLPKLLPRFNELGLLHVHYGGGRDCRAVDDSCLRHDKPECLREDFHDGGYFVSGWE